jgi:hypothetical protein
VCLTVASALDAGERFFPLTMPCIAGLILLRTYVPLWARDTGDARRSSVILDVVMSAVFVAGVRTWTLGPSLMMSGYVANHLAIVCNGLAMPSIRSLGINPTYVPVTSDTRLRWLADIFVSQPGKQGDADFSIGDALIAVGLWVFAAEIILARFVP